MGNSYAIGIAEEVHTGSLDLGTALHWHLQSNCYPPVHLSMVEPCRKAIDAVNESVPGELISLPKGILWKGMDQAPASALVESYHLEAFLTQEDEY